MHQAIQIKAKNNNNNNKKLTYSSGNQIIAKTY